MRSVPLCQVSLLVGFLLVSALLVLVFHTSTKLGVSISGQSDNRHHHTKQSSLVHEEDHTVRHESEKQLYPRLLLHRVRRQLVAYRRLEAGPVLPVLASRGKGGGGREGRGRRGEDGTDIGLFRSVGVGQEHHHNNRCKESKCGYNIRHCPHGCVFNSFLCGGGAMYDTCCC